MFSAAIDLRRGDVVVRVAGELDVATLPCLEGVVEGLVDAGTTRARLPRALRRVVSLTGDGAAAGVDLTVLHLSAFTVELLGVTGLTGVKLGSV